MVIATSRSSPRALWVREGAEVERGEETPTEKDIFCSLKDGKMHQSNRWQKKKQYSTNSHIFSQVSFAIHVLYYCGKKTPVKCSVI